MKNKPVLDSADVKLIAAAAEAEALKNQWAVTIAIVDGGGHLLHLQRQANALIKADAPRLKVDFIDVFTPMLDAQGQPREELFLPDRLHMNAAGYEVWKQAVHPYLDSDAKP